MKVLYTTNVPSPYRMDFFNELGRYCELTVLFETDRAADRDEKWITQKEGSFQAIYMKQWYRGTDTAFCPEVIRHYKRIKADILVVGGYSTPTGMYLIQYLRRHRVPFLLNCDGGLIKEDSRIMERVKRHFIGSAAWWLSTGNACSDYLVHYGAKRSGIFVYPFTSINDNDILEHPLSEGEKQDIRKRLSMKEQKIIISVGQFIYRKGYDILIEAMKDEPDIGVYLIGGEPLPEYQDRKSRYGMEHLHFVEFKEKAALKDYYKAADVFVLPTREDIWGLVINEAMAYGLPVVTTSQCVAGQELIINGMNGYLVEAEDALQLEDRIKKLIENPPMRKIMQENNLTKMKDYTIQKMARRHIEIFNQINSQSKKN